MDRCSNILCENGNCIGCKNGQLYCQDPRCFPNCPNCENTTDDCVNTKDGWDWALLIIILSLSLVLLLLLAWTWWCGDYNIDNGCGLKNMEYKSEHMNSQSVKSSTISLPEVPRPNNQLNNQLNDVDFSRSNYNLATDASLGLTYPNDGPSVGNAVDNIRPRSVLSESQLNFERPMTSSQITGF